MIKSINIMSSEYKILTHGTYWSDEPVRGDIDYHNRTINIKESTKDNMSKTLFHEIIHGIAMELNLYDEEHNEKFIDTLAVGLYDTLKRNKLLNEGKK